MSYQDMKIEGEIYDDFMTIVPRDGYYLDYNVGPIPLPVIATDGVNYTPDVKITVNDLNSGKKTFINGCGEGDKFKVNVIINKNATVQGKKEVENPVEIWNFGGTIWRFGGGTSTVTSQIRVTEALDYWIKNMTLFTVTTRAADIPNGTYVITANPSRKQNYENYTVWELEFTKYVGNVVIGVTWDNTYANKAIAAYKKKKSAAAKSASKNKAKQASTTSNTLSKCKVSEMKYSKTKKVTNCTKLLQKYLNKKLDAKLKVDGWYGDSTKKWVHKFQSKYKKKHKLNVSGNMNDKTLKAMLKEP